MCYIHAKRVTIMTRGHSTSAENSWTMRWRRKSTPAYIHTDDFLLFVINAIRNAMDIRDGTDTTGTCIVNKIMQWQPSNSLADRSKSRPTVEMICKSYCQRSDGQWTVTLDQDRFTGLLLFPSEFIQGSFQPLYVFIPLKKIYGTIDSKISFPWRQGRFFLSDEWPHLEAMTRLRRWASIHSIVQVCSKPRLTTPSKVLLYRAMSGISSWNKSRKRKSYARCHHHNNDADYGKSL